MDSINTFTAYIWLQIPLNIDSTWVASNYLPTIEPSTDDVPMCLQ